MTATAGKPAPDFALPTGGAGKVLAAAKEI